MCVFPVNTSKQTNMELLTTTVSKFYTYINLLFSISPWTTDPPERCFLPKKQIHAWVNAHARGVAAVRLFPQTGHLMLSAGMDTKIKLWELYKERRLIRSYMGHRQAVRDVCFNNNGTSFLSASYDRYVKLWDTEVGKCTNQFNLKRVAYCVRFNPDDDKQHLFLAGCSDKKILCYDTRSGEVVQQYDRHLGAVNAVAFVDNNRRFVSTSDDKSLRVWEWDIPVDFKYLADPSLHSMPAVTVSPNGMLKYPEYFYLLLCIFAVVFDAFCQSMFVYV
ncbi:unnamed protein product [Trichobilharzia regenti]|nr:unnamed protein product [Trichobilharzia regenti]